MNRIRQLRVGQIVLLWIAGFALMAGGLFRVPERVVSAEYRAEYSRVNVPDVWRRAIHKRIASHPRQQDSLIALRDTVRGALVQLGIPPRCASRDKFELARESAFDASMSVCRPTDSLLQRLVEIETPIAPLPEVYWAVYTVERARTQSFWLRTGGFVWLALALVITSIRRSARTHSSASVMPT